MDNHKNGPVNQTMTAPGKPQIPLYPGPYHIPVLIDDIKRLDEFNMTRCSVFTIEAANAVEDWVTQLRARRIPFLLFGISAVLHRPSSKRVRFTDPQQIDDLFDAIETIEGLVVETSHIWLPNFIFPSRKEWRLSRDRKSPSTTRGAVWRISFDIFQHALRFGHGSISTEQFIAECQALVDIVEHPATYSARETTVFRRWSVAQIQAAQANYDLQRADPERRVLDWRAEDGVIHAG